MGDLVKKQRQLLRQAKQTPQLQEAVRDEQRFCSTCRAVTYADGICPHCDKHQASYLRFCGSCLRVHGSQVTCAPWRPRES